jgi:predicted lipoprotein with Yx(FWY)xxD motif
VSLAKGAQGIFLIGPNGHTLYIFTKDHGTASACKKAECAKFWSALTATGALKSGPGINAKDVKTAHGQVKHQVTYYGHLLYYFKGDASPGQTNGAKVASWDLLGPFGNVMLPRA